MEFRVVDMDWACVDMQISDELRRLGWTAPWACCCKFSAVSHVWISSRGLCLCLRYMEPVLDVGSLRALQLALGCNSTPFGCVGSQVACFIGGVPVEEDEARLRLAQSHNKSVSCGAREERLESKGAPHIAAHGQG